MREIDEQAADRLEDAADYLEEHGWTQGTTVDSFGRCCVLGALANGRHGGMTRDRDLLQEEVGGSIPGWNDTLGQTAENVIATMRGVAAKARATERKFNE